MFAITAADEKFASLIDFWEEIVIACGFTPLIYDLGGLGRGEKFIPLVKGYDLFRETGYYSPGHSGVHKPFVIQQATQDINGPFLYLDTDVILRGTPTRLFGDWDISVTVKQPHEWQKFAYEKKTYQAKINTGVLWFSDCQYHQFLADFISLWKQLTAQVEDDALALDILLDKITRDGALDALAIKAMPFPTELYNHYYAEEPKKAVIVHLSGNRWMDKSHQELLSLCLVVPAVSQMDLSPLLLEKSAASDLLQLDSYPDVRDVVLKPSMKFQSGSMPGLPIDKYEGHPEAVVISCFFNPQCSPYRLLAFQKFYRSIKHLNYRIYECLIGENAKSQLPDDPNIIRVHADDLLWHKESLLNMAVKDLPKEFKYVFIIDADVLFTNPKWMVECVKTMRQSANVMQPFEFCVHLKKNQLVPDFDLDFAKRNFDATQMQAKKMWRSFCSNALMHPQWAASTHYHTHGHVGFAWGFRREVLNNCPLFEKALIGGADHILAHAVVGHIPHPCIYQAFADNINEVSRWSRQMYMQSDGIVSYVPGDLLHIWHGDIKDRQYLKRVKEFTADCKDFVKDAHGFYRLPRSKARYMNRYYRQREILDIDLGNLDDFDFGFFDDMGYMLADIINLFGQPQFNDEPKLGDPDFVPDVVPQELTEDIDYSNLTTPLPVDQWFRKPLNPDKLIEELCAV